MRRRTIIWLTLLTGFFMCGTGRTAAQKYPERSDIRKGNRNYEGARYAESEADYRRALEKDPSSFEAQYNLGNAMYRQGEWEGAEALFARLKEAPAPEADRMKAHFNTGNSMFQQRKLQEALEEYKEALRLDPNDMEAKFNLAYVKKMLDDDDNDGGGGDDQNDDNDDQNDQDNEGGGEGGDNNDPDQDQGDDNEDKNDQNNDQNKDNDRDQNGDGKRPPGMTRDEAENLLEAVQMNEDKTKEKMDEEKGKAVGTSSGKNW